VSVIETVYGIFCTTLTTFYANNIFLVSCFCIPPLMPYLKFSDMQAGRPALFWDIKQRMVENHYRRFGTAYRSNLQRSSNFRFLDR